MGINNIKYENGKYIIKHLETDIVRHCNLNCKGCYHFSPLFKNDPCYIDFDKWTKALKYVAETFEIREFGILGGEPLLHPQWMDFLRFARITLPNANIQLWTNGTLEKELNKYLTELHNLNIQIIISEYPIIKTSKGLASKNLNKTYLQNLSLDLERKQDSDYNFNMCGSKNCLQLTDTYIYKCPVAYNLEKVKKYFNLSNLKFNLDEIRINVFNTSKEEFFDWATSSTLCSICNREAKENSKIKWDFSKQDLLEWFEGVDKHESN